jgi:UPF0755 protein
MLKFIRISLALVFPMILTALLVIWYLNGYMKKELPLADSTEIFVLQTGTGFSSMVNQLAERGWIDHPQILQLYGRLNNSFSDIKAGEYRFYEGISVAEALAMMQKGDVVRRQLTLLEGWSMAQVLSYLQSQPLLAEQVLSNDLSLWPQLGIESPLADTPEGLFFPDTYDYYRDDTPSLILLRAYKKMLRVLNEEWELKAADLPYENAYQALIMASIIEKETGVASERAEIAGVFVRRLRKGMRLQTDPTVIYGLGDSYQGNLRGSHLRDDSNLYNTYRQDGLPPSPIALAGREAINAALHPAAGKTIFFVAKGDGTHQFSVTLKEHEAAVKHYQLSKRRANYRSAPPVEAK